jgi:hypothetical protein
MLNQPVNAVNQEQNFFGKAVFFRPIKESRRKGLFFAILATES